MRKIVSIGSAIGLVLSTFAFALPAIADSSSINFESPTYTTGSISGQDGWSNAVNPAYDQAVVANTYGFSSFGGQSFRISDAVTSGSFGDWVFTKSLVNEAGETAAQNGGLSGGVRQPHFEASFDLASTLPALQAGMHVSVSPDRGDGARMSYLRFEDRADGIHVFFDDYQDGKVEPAGTCVTGDNFVETDIATITRTPHNIKFVMDFVNGQNNDVVKIYVDGVLKITGTSWEGYFNYCELNPTRTVDSLIIQSRTGSGPVTNPADQGNGFLFDNLSLSSSTPPCFVSTGGKGLGYWTNKNGQALENAADFTALTGLNLVKADGSARDFTGTLAQNKTDLNSWLLGATATNMAYMLSAQLAAVQLSVSHGFTDGNAQITTPWGTMTINALINTANAELLSHPVTKAGSAFRAYQESLKNILEKVANGASIQICTETFTASDSLYYNGPTNAAPLYGTGPITFTWDPVSGNVTGGLYEEIVPPTTGTHYFNNVTGGTVVGGVVNLTFLRTNPNNYGPFTFTGTLSGGTLTGTLDGPYYFTATGTVTP